MAFSSTNKCLLAALTVIALWASHAASRTLTDTSTMEKHEQWMAEYGRVYKDAAEKEQRSKTFQANVELIESFNAAGNHKYKLGINQFADLTNEEFTAMYTGFKPSQASSGMATKSFKYESATAVPASMDWRAKGAVTPIKDQGQCGIYVTINHFISTVQHPSCCKISACLYWSSICCTNNLTSN